MRKAKPQCNLSFNPLTYHIFRDWHAQGCVRAELLSFNYLFYYKLNTSKLFRHLGLGTELSIVTQKCYKLLLSTSFSSSLLIFLCLRLAVCWLGAKLFGIGSMSVLLHQVLAEWGTPILLRRAIATVQVMVIMITADT